MTSAVIDLIEAKLSINWSPEQISGWLKQEQGLAISHERIYQHIWADKLNGVEGRCISTFGTVARSASNMAPRAIGGRSGTVSVLMTDLG
jgi:IS30 family transposase